MVHLACFHLQGQCCTHELHANTRVCLVRLGAGFQELLLTGGLSESWFLRCWLENLHSWGAIQFRRKAPVPDAEYWVHAVGSFTDIVQLGQKCIDFPKTIGKVVIDLIRRCQPCNPPMVLADLVWCRLLLYNPERRLGMNGGSAGACLMCIYWLCRYQPQSEGRAAHSGGTHHTHILSKYVPGVRKHAYFKKLNWDKLEARELEVSPFLVFPTRWCRRGNSDSSGACRCGSRRSWWFEQL